MSLTKLGKSLRKNILEASYIAQAGHIPSAFSIVEILCALYFHVLEEEDVFVLSKGHGCLALYSIFLEKGLISRKEFLNFSNYDSILGGHPHRNKLKEIYASTGSLGHGLPICVGSALAKKLSKSMNKVYCLVGDGECNEGTIWESAMIANKLNLNNLICIVDNNNSQARSMPTTDLENKFTSFGWQTVVVGDGHNLNSLKKAITKNSDKPLCIICNTTKGNGIKKMEENMFVWHHGPPSETEYNLFCEELNA